MPKVSAKRQITLPIELCKEAHIEPGDEIEAYLFNGQITVVHKEKSAAKGILKKIKSDKRISDEQSLQDYVDSNDAGAA